MRKRKTAPTAPYTLTSEDVETDGRPAAIKEDISMLTLCEQKRKEWLARYSTSFNRYSCSKDEDLNK